MNHTAEHPIINVPKRKLVLPSAAQTKTSKGVKICTHIVLALTGEQKVISQPSQYYNFPYQGGAIHGFYISMKNKQS